MTNREELKLCKCYDGKLDVARTVRKINDDFSKCPRCGGLIVNGQQRVAVDKTYSDGYKDGFNNAVDAVKESINICQRYYTVEDADMSMKEMSETLTRLREKRDDRKESK